MMSRSRGFYFDKITNSIERLKTGEHYDTDVVLVLPDQIGTILKKDSWFFNWRKEYEQVDHQVYKLVLTGTDDIQGLISIEVVSDEKHIEMHMAETAPHNYGRKKEFAGVSGNLVAYACRTSFELGFDGIVAFTARTKLVEHYSQTIGTQQLYRGQGVAILRRQQKNWYLHNTNNSSNDGQRILL